MSDHQYGVPLSDASFPTTITNSPSVFDDHIDALRGQVFRTCRTIQNPVHRVCFKLGSDVAVQDLANNLSMG